MFTKIMPLLKRIFATVNGDGWIVEPEYKLFFINFFGNKIRVDKFPNEKIIEIAYFRQDKEGFIGYILPEGSTLKLLENDLLEVLVRNFPIEKNMSILEKSSAISNRFLIYSGDGHFKEIDGIKNWNR